MGIFNFGSKKTVETPKKKLYEGNWYNIFGDTSDRISSYRTTWVDTAVNIRATNVSKADILLYRKQNKQEVEVEKHPFLDVIYNPNLYEQTFNELLYLISISLDVYGEAFVYVAKSKGKKPNSFFLLPTNKVTPIVDENTGQISHFDYSKQIKSVGNIVRYSPDEIIFFKLPNIDRVFRGCATIDSCKTVIDIDNYQQTFQKKFFVNDGSVNVVIEADEQLSEEEVARLQAAFDARTGVENSNSWILLQDGLKYNTTKTTQKEMDFVNSRNAVRDEILGKMSVPKSIVGLSDTVNRATAEAEQWNFIANVIEPFSRFIVDKFNIFIKKNYGPEYYIKFEYDLPGDPQTDIDMYDMLFRNGAITVGELREAFGFSTDKPGGTGKVDPSNEVIE